MLHFELGLNNLMKLKKNVIEKKSLNILCYTYSSSCFAFSHLYLGSALLIIFLKLALSSVIASVKLFSFRSLLILVIQVVGGLPGPLFLVSMLSATLTRWSSALLMTCPYQRMRCSVNLSCIGATLKDPLTCMFLTWSSRVTPPAHLNMRIYAACSCCSWTLFAGQHSEPYSIAGRTTDLYSLPFTLTGMRWSHKVPDNSRHFSHPVLIRCVTSASIFPSQETIEPRYLNLSDFGNALPSKVKLGEGVLSQASK